MPTLPHSEVMKNKRNMLCILGTRPEAIKLAPVVRALETSSWARCVVVATAQHRNLLDQMLERLNIDVDYDLDLMQEGQEPSNLLARMLPALDAVIKKEMPAAILAQGDTTTVLGAALSAFHAGVPFGHVEAGLRTHDLAHPFPEEGYRQMVSRITHWHFAPTIHAANALRDEGIAEDRIHITGNTCIDTLLQTVAELGSIPKQKDRLILLTAHRRENFGASLQSIFMAVKEIVRRFPDVRVVYPVHPNPNVRRTAEEMLAGCPRIELRDPLDYFEFVDLMRRASIILTDSGGIQEEAPALGKPVLVLRNTTERPEAVDCGCSKIIGTNQKNIVDEASKLLSSSQQLDSMSQVHFPYGNGTAGSRIAYILKDDIRS